MGIRNLLKRFLRWFWRQVTRAARWIWPFSRTQIYFLPVALVAYILYVQLPLLTTQRIDASTVALLTLLIIAFVLWLGGPSMISRIQELGPLKLAPRVEREVERLRPEIESALQEMEGLDQALAANLYLDPTLPPDETIVVERALNRVSPLLTAVRLIEDPQSFSEELKAVYCLLGYWEGRLLYHLGFMSEAIGKWDSVWRIGGPDVLRKLSPTRFRIADFCVYVGNAYVLRSEQVHDQSPQESLLKLAVDWYRRALEYDLDLIPALFNLAWAYDELGMYGRAFSTLDALLGIDPTFVQALYNRACAKTKAGELDRAIEDLERIPCPHAVWTQARTDADFQRLRESEYRQEFETRVRRCQPPAAPLRKGEAGTGQAKGAT